MVKICEEIQVTKMSQIICKFIFKYILTILLRKFCIFCHMGTRECGFFSWCVMYHIWCEMCLFTVLQNIVPLATLWNKNLRIIMICPSTATFPGIMICHQCEDHPPHRHGDCPVDHLENNLKTLFLWNHCQRQLSVLQAE